MERSLNAKLRTRRWIHIVFCATFAPAPLAQSQSEKPPEFPAPGQIGNVVCMSDTTQRYALYLPSAYAPSRRWPIIYFFDPGGRGGRPIELYKDIAERYGFIFAGSNNSRNFSGNQSNAVNAIWLDTHQRLSIDERRSYTSGFSGGARVAGLMALSGAEGQIAGVIAHGAGYPSNRALPKNSFNYFFAVGDQDFNWPEIMSVRSRREDAGLPYRMRVFAGPHQWAPSAVMEEAVQWINLKAMQAGTLAPAPSFIDQMFRQRQAEADDAEKNMDALAQLSAYRSLASDFSGLRDVTAATAKLTALKQSPTLKAALTSEMEQIADQSRVEAEISPLIDAYAQGSSPDAAALRLEIHQRIGGLRDQAAHAKNEKTRLISIRTFEGIWAEAIESGQRELEQRHFEKAEAYFDLMKQVTDRPWPALLLAETHATAGNKKLAIKDLREAVKRGLKDAEALESDPHLQALKDDPEFQKLVASLKGK